jgi:hypothetical protein
MSPILHLSRLNLPAGNVPLLSIPPIFLSPNLFPSSLSPYHHAAPLPQPDATQWRSQACVVARRLTLAKGGISEQEEERRRVGGDLEGARAGEWRIL